MSVLEILGTLLIGPLKLVFEIIFSLAHRITGDPGLGIIVLSMTMNILLLPMYRRADAIQEAARDMDAKLRGGVAHIKKAFSGDERMMILQTYYRQNHYSPVSALNGSLSLLLEIPFFMAAYQVLSGMEIMQGMAFGPIGDLSLPDGLLVLGDTTLNLLPIVMTAVNVVSCVIYLKGYPFQTKLQLYAMAAFFLVFLYDSPSCLVFYWTLNNVFSLAKNLVCRLKEPRKAVQWICAVTGLGLLWFTLFRFQPETTKQKLFLLVLSMAFLIPLVKEKLLSRLQLGHIQLARDPKLDQKLFLLGGLFMTVLTGLLIPGTFLAASPQEYVDIRYFYHPLWYMLWAACLSAGTFLVWFGVFYYLASPSARFWIARLMWGMAGVMLVNYMFYGTELGIISAELQYNNGLFFSIFDQLKNLAVVGVIFLSLLAVVYKWPKLAVMALLTGSLAMAGMAGVHGFTVRNAVQNLNTEGYQEKGEAGFRLSKTGKNVVVLMLDRAMGSYVPYLFAEKPELAQQFEGFTYYSNAISFGGSTNFGMPGMMGGYEYTPVEINRRDTEKLVDKHNEAIKVMPVAFLEEGYEVTVCDPPYANYQWIPDLSIFNDYPQIDAYLTENLFVDNAVLAQSEKRGRNFFCFSLMKSMPLILQDVLYDDGLYNQKIYDPGIQTTEGLTQADGIYVHFKKWFSVLSSLADLTTVTEEPANTYLFLQNSATHEPQMLQMPDYTMEEQVDNSQWFSQHDGGLVENGRLLKLETSEHMIHYHSNMASLMQLGKWFDYLRQNGVYDNTRIILVSDHAMGLGQMEQLPMDQYFPLLMVKDFDSHTFTTSDEFMTNADVPYLAMEGLMENPTNPFTGNPISMEEKTAHDQFIILSSEWDTNTNNGNVFLESRWASVKDDIWDRNNWIFYDETTVLKEHAAP